MALRGLVLLLLLLCPAWAGAETTRFALVVGNNAGRSELPPLRFAEADAGKMARVLIELGDVGSENLQLLQGRSAPELEAAIAALHAKVAPFTSSPDSRTVLIFYFSGHSDGEGIEMGNAILPYSRLKTLLAGVGTDVRVVIVDACRSGAGYRQKGGKPADEFAIKLTDSLATTGDAFISSSTEDEAAVEAGEISGSVFTHNLVSGLRGAADASGDKQITLTEAYRYAYEQTVSRTALLGGGSQHPSYDYRLSGQGELVLTTLLKPSATLVLPGGAERTVLTDVLRDQVVVEVPKGAGQVLALPPGQYGVRLFKQGQSFGGRITLVEGARRELAWNDVSPVSSAMQLAAKGGPIVSQRPEPTWDEARVLGLSLGVAPSVGQVGLEGMLRVFFEPRAGRGLSFALLGAHAQVQSVAESQLEARVGYRFSWQLGPVWLGAGAEAGPAVVLQSDAAGSYVSAAGVLAPRVGARVDLGTAFTITADGELGVELLSIDGKVTGVFRPAATLGVAFRF